MNHPPPAYDRSPTIPACGPAECRVGWDAIAAALRPADGRHLCVDCYVGVDVDQVVRELAARVPLACVVDTRDLFHDPHRIEQLVAPFCGGDDPLFGFLCNLTLEHFLCPDRVAAARRRVAEAGGPALVVGPGAAHVIEAGVLVWADMPRWENQRRQRRGAAANLGTANAGTKASLQYKRSFFVDWRVCDRWKKPLLRAAEFFLDTTRPDEPKLAAGAAVRAALAGATRRPFRVVPFFDPGPWGGQWLRRVCDLGDYDVPPPPNYAWCFDCVPEENSLQIDFGVARFELPSLDLLFLHPRELLGDPVHARFGEEFPIRFDLLDTMGGGNLSLQVHPPVGQIQREFGLHYTQDESYYILDATDDGAVYLGLRDDARPDVFLSALERAHRDGDAFDADRHVNRLPARRHDHFLIPAGTVHCSGRNTVVLEVSATPYLFTFKLWDWGRLGLDGLPRPINLARARDAIDWERTAGWADAEAVNRVEALAAGPGWREERTGLHPRQFIETRRHWFRGRVPHHTGGVPRGGVHVLNLVAGRRAVVESPDRAFDPYVVHYAESFIVPAAVGPYTLRPCAGETDECVTVRASVRTGL